MSYVTSGLVALSLIAFVSITDESRGEPSSTCLTQLAAAEAEVRNEFRLSKLTIDLAPEETCAQIDQIANTVSIKDALVAGMRSFLRDGSHSESPYALAMHLAFDRLDVAWTDPAPPAVTRSARISLTKHVNREGSVLRVLGRDEVPEGGESVDANWIFALKIPSQSDHLHWAVIERSGEAAAYNYGFN